MSEKSPLQLLADECVYKATTDFLLSLGYDVVTAQELGFSGADDDVIIDRAVALSRILVSRDMDFSNILLYPPAQYLDIVVLKMSPATMHAVQSTEAGPRTDARSCRYVACSRQKQIPHPPS